MTSQQLQCFICAADKLNFTKAAEELFLSTPTVTHHIKSLENELNAVLFIRTSKTVCLTEAGVGFYSDAKEILSKMTLAERKVRKLIHSNLTFLRIGCTSNPELDFLEELLDELQVKYPQVLPQIFVHDYFTLKNLFSNKQLDMMLATKEMVKDLSACSFRKMKTITTYAVLSEKSHLSTKKEISFHDLEKERLIIPQPRFIPFRSGNKLQEKKLLHSQAHFDLMCENDQAAVLLAKCGYGVALLPEFFIPANMEHLIILPVSDEEENMDYGIACQEHEKADHIKYLVKKFCY